MTKRNCVICLTLFVLAGAASAQTKTPSAKVSFEREKFTIDKRPAFIIPPTKKLAGPTPWVLYAPTLGRGLPGKAEHWMFRQFLSAGIAIAGVDVGESYGSPRGRATYNALHKRLTETHGFAQKACLLARSRGGLMLYCWAAENPEKVKCVAGIYPVCNIASYPGLKRACGAYGLTAKQLEADLSKHNPPDRLAALAKANVPIFHIHGDVDRVVPLAANSGLLAERYKAAGGKMELLVVKGQGHNMWRGFFECQGLVDFVIKNAVAAADPLAKTIQVGGVTFDPASPPKPLVTRRDLGLVTAPAVEGQLVHKSKQNIFETRATITPGGDYLLMFPEGKHYGGRKGKVNTMIAYRSSDKGKTWAGSKAAFDIDYSQHGFIPLIPRGTKRIYAFGTQPIEGKREGRENCPIGFRYSDDDGRTWSKVTLIRPKNNPDFLGMSVMRMCETDAGTWLLGSHEGRWKRTPTGPVGTRAYVLRSEDKGKTWTVLPGKRPGGWYLEKFGRLDEPRPINLGGGKAMILARSCEGHLFETRSNDDGKTWSKPKPTALVADDAAGETDQDRSEGRGPFPVRGLPDGGGRRAEAVVPGDPGADKAAAVAEHGAGMTARTVKSAGEGESTGEGLRGSDVHVARQGILGDIMHRKRPAPPSIGQEQRLQLPDSAVESPDRPPMVVGRSLSGKSRLMAIRARNAMKATRMILTGMLVALLLGSAEISAAAAAPTDKTLVAWVTLDNMTQRGGSVLTIQSAEKFDAIVFGERKQGSWMAGSDGLRRTEKTQDAYPAETADSGTLVQMAIVYEGKAIRIYRNGEPYASYEAANIDLLTAKNAMAVFGLRHVGARPGNRFSGSIDDARIYARALTPGEIKSLIPNKASEIPVYAWWDFEGDTMDEKTGKFPHSMAKAGAKLEKGKLVLGNDSVLVATQTKDAVKKGNVTYVPHTPTMPENPPKTWLTYHLAHPGPDRAIPGDTNCAIFYKGRYHLHYIYQSDDRKPSIADKGHSFAHVSSTDMVHWKWHPTVLTPPKTGHGMFSGTAFLTREGRPAIIYHGWGSGRNQIALALDDTLDKWSETVSVEPKTADGKAPKVRTDGDPDCWLMGDTYYALAGGNNPTLAKSKDLKNWEFLGELFHPDFPKDLGVAKGENTACANMFKIGNKWMLLCISHGLGARYYLGDFKDEKFLPTHHAMFNWARWDCFAPESLLTPDGRRVMWAWCTPWVNKNLQKVGRKKNFDALMKGKLQPGIQSLPRELSLPKDGVLRIKPLRELEQLRADKKREKRIQVKSDTTYTLKEIAGDTMELEIVFDEPSASEFGVKVLCGEDGSGGFTISSGNASKTLKVGYINPPFELKKGEDLTLRIFIDKSMIEVFANDRQAAVAWHEYNPKDLHVSLFTKGGDLKVKAVTSWKMNSIYTKAAAEQ